MLDLHVPDGAKIADVTYGNGSFWGRVPSGKYDLVATDIDPNRSPSSDEGVDCRDLPYGDDSFDCVVLDPPYKSGAFEPADKPTRNDFWITERYRGASDGELTYHDAVVDLYARAGQEAQRVLDDGVLIVKVQDGVSKNEQHLTHVELVNIYEELGFEAEDLFVVIRPDTPTIGKIYEQRRARKNHSYFLVFVLG